MSSKKTTFFLFDPNEPAKGIIRLTAFFWLIEKMISWRSWTTLRLFPLVPVHEYLHQLPDLLQNTFFAIDLLLILFVLVVPLNKKVLFSLLMVEVFLCVADQNRWQPWEYQNLFVLLTAIFYKKEKLAPVCFFILGCTYFYSGLHKLNPNFLELVWKNMMLKQFFQVPSSVLANKWVIRSGYLIGLIELMAGISLFFSRLRVKGVVILILMHVFILFLIGPVGLRYNVIVWPWNAYLIGLLMGYLHWRKYHLEPLQRIQLSGIKFIVLFWAILPMGSKWEWWDQYLSSNLYGGDAPKALLCLDNKPLPAKLSPFISKPTGKVKCLSTSQVNLQQWAMKEMNVPVYPERRIYESILQQWNRAYPGSPATLMIYR